jgi:hypothetical protein
MRARNAVHARSLSRVMSVGLHRSGTSSDLRNAAGSGPCFRRVDSVVMSQEQRVYSGLLFIHSIRILCLLSVSR